MDLDPELPLVTADLPGTGGAIKLEPAHFVVEEIPLYEASGEGEHVFLTVRREGRTTREVQRALAAAFGIEERDVGCAGQKDKVARVTQAFSLPVREGSAEEVARRAAHGTGETGLEVLAARRHGNKLRRGHLAGNRFEVLVAGARAGSAATARAVAAALAEAGVPNFFGEQRLGPGGRGARRGRARLEDRPGARASFVGRMQLSAWQSSLYNAWLAERMARGWFRRVLAGDLARVHGTGGLFEVLDEAAEAERCARGEISATGPIFGSRMRPARGRPEELEREVLAASGIGEEALARARLDGSRRSARVFLEAFGCEEASEGLRMRFRLEKGAFATIALREFTKTEG